MATVLDEKTPMSFLVREFITLNFLVGSWQWPLEIFLFPSLPPSFLPLLSAPAPFSFLFILLNLLAVHHYPCLLPCIFLPFFLPFFPSRQLLDGRGRERLHKWLGCIREHYKWSHEHRSSTEAATAFQISFPLESWIMDFGYIL